jgi:hypothetical protein
MKEITRPWTWRDQLEVVCYGAPLHLATLAALSFAKATGLGCVIANQMSRANNRFVESMRPGGRRVVRMR